MKRASRRTWLRVLTAGLSGLAVAAGLASAQTRQPLKSQANLGCIGAILLLTDGTVDGDLLYAADAFGVLQYDLWRQKTREVQAGGFRRERLTRFQGLMACTGIGAVWSQSRTAWACLGLHSSNFLPTAPMSPQALSSSTALITWNCQPRCN
jgi:hypothetical protein